MKKIIKISLLILIILVVKTELVYGKTLDDSFYPGNFIEGEYIKKTKNGNSEYKQSRFIFRTSDNRFAYCIAPFDLMKENETYKAYNTDYTVHTKLTSEIWDKVRLISYYGYRYGNHTASKWYTITQLMIWKTIDPHAKFEWTDTLGGNVITKYEKEMDEINQLVKDHNKLPNYANKEYNISINKPFNLEDSSFNVNNFNVNSSDDLQIKKNTNSLTITPSKVGKYELDLSYKNVRFTTVPIVYVDSTAQNLMVIGDNDEIKFKVKLNVESGKKKKKKTDKDTNTIYSLGESSIIGTIYGLYNNQLIDKMIIDDTGEAHLDNLPYGDYCILELETQKGYLKDENKYCFNINHNKLNIELNLQNEIMKQEITINKYTQEKSGDKPTPEPNITFDIKGIKHNFEQKITTNKFGEASIILPYGKYLFHQVNTTNGYKKVEDFIVNVDGKTKNYDYELINVKKIKIIKKKQYQPKTKKNTEPLTYTIPVPNTSSNRPKLREILVSTIIIFYIFIMRLDYDQKNKVIFN